MQLSPREMSHLGYDIVNLSLESLETFRPDVNILVSVYPSFNQYLLDVVVIENGLALISNVTRMKNHLGH